MGKFNPYDDWQKYPEEDGRKSGCKVSWNYYRDEAKAKACAESAISNARIAASEGYDFGYCAPGSIEISKGGEFEGMYRVCLP